MTTMKTVSIDAVGIFWRNPSSNDILSIFVESIFVEIELYATPLPRCHRSQFDMYCSGNVSAEEVIERK